MTMYRMKSAQASLPKTIDFTYDAAGRMKSIARNSGAGSFQLNTSYDYDGVRRHNKIDYARPSIGTIASFDYQYDAASRLTDVDEFFLAVIPRPAAK